MIPQAWTRSAWGLAVGVVVLVLVSALLTAAVYSVSATHDLHSLSRKMLDAQEKNERDSTESEQRSRQAKAERQALLDQNATLQAQLKALVTYLRDHGIQVPSATPAPEPSLQPQPPQPSRPPTPRSNAKPSASPKPTPTAKPTTNPACTLFPILCLPLSFPKEVGNVGLPRQASDPKARGEQHPRHPKGKASRVHGD